MNMSEVTMEEVEKALLHEDPGLAPGGRWRPLDCQPRWKVNKGLVIHDSVSKGSQLQLM